jgi:hypothetical protein
MNARASTSVAASGAESKRSENLKKCSGRPDVTSNRCTSTPLMVSSPWGYSFSQVTMSLARVVKIYTDQPSWVTRRSAIILAAISAPPTISLP